MSVALSSCIHICHEMKSNADCKVVQGNMHRFMYDGVCGELFDGLARLWCSLLALIVVMAIVWLLADALYSAKHIVEMEDHYGLGRRRRSTRRSETDDHDNGNMVRSSVIVRGVEVAGEATERVDGITNLRVTENDGARGMEMVFVDMELSKTERIDDDVVHEEGCNNEHVDETGEVVIRCDGTTITRYKVLNTV